MSDYGVMDLAQLAISGLWILLDLLLAAVVIYRFRATASGILMCGALALMSAKNLVGTLAWHLVIRPMTERAWDLPWEAHEAVIAKQNLFFLGRSALSFLLMFVLAVGVVLIPLSLGRLRTR